VRTTSSAPRTRSLVAVSVMITVTLTAGMWSPAPAEARQAPVTAASPAPIAWGPCARAGLIRANAECGYLTVPLDYDRPDGQTIELAVSRVRHTTPDDQYQGVMLVNPGGPGGSGLPYAALGRIVPKGAGAAYDWIGFDPRGVGASRPALTCDPNVLGADRPEYVPRTSALERTWLNRSRRYADACRSRGGALLDHLTTIEWARDMDSIRAALGAAQLNFFGFSYGTYLGQVYATRYPERVRRMVFDGTVDPRNIWYQANLNQDIAFETTIKEWFAWVARYDAVYHLGATAEAVESHWYADQRKLRDAPAGGLVGPSEWADMFLQAGYYQGTWLDLAALWATWVAVGDPTPVIAQFQNTNNPGNDNLYAIYLGVECTDAPWPKDWDQWRRDNWRTHARAPFYTWGNAWFNAPCAFWRARSHSPQEIDGAAAPGVLMVNETLDAATPYEGSLEVRRRFPRASLIAVPGGTTHAGSLNGNACVDDQIADYLLSGTLPPRKDGDEADATCDPLPQPDPTAPDELTQLTTNEAAAPATARPDADLVPAPAAVLRGRR
jgi:pimeloyl-ACP methyl ester carboxylesterase